MLKVNFLPIPGNAQNTVGERITLDLKALMSMLEGVHTQNSGTWLYPHVVDNFIEIEEMKGGSNGSVAENAGNNRVIDLYIESIANTQVECVLDGTEYDEPVDYLEIKRIDKGQMNFPNQNLWENIFDLGNGENYTVSPNGSLYVTNNGDNALRLKFQDKESLLSVLDGNDFLALSYSICFHFKMSFRQEPVYCIVDPVVQIRSNPK